MLKLPELVWNLDCEPLGYPGLTITFVLNPPVDEFRPAWAVLDPERDRDKIARMQAAAQPWENEYYHSIGRFIKKVSVPAQYTDGSTDLVIPVGSGKAVWDLERDPGFDPQVLQWAVRQYSEQRQERVKAEQKN